MSSWLLLTMLPVALGAPGMLEWICASCSNPNMVYTAQAEVRTGNGELVGQLRLLQSVPRDDAGKPSGPVLIDTEDNRVPLEGLKTYNFNVEIHRGNCDNIGDIVAGQYCSRCTNSLGVAIIKDKEGQEMVLSSITDSHSVVFFSKSNQSKLGCGEIKNGAVEEKGK